MPIRSMSEDEEQHEQSSDLPTVGYEAAEEERQSLRQEEEEGRSASIAEVDEGDGNEEEEQKEVETSEFPRLPKRNERRESKRRSSNTTTIATATSAWQVTLFDLDKQLNKQGRLMERMSDDIRHLRKQFNQVQRDLLKFEKRMQKIKPTTRSPVKRKERRR
ncbi:MAG: hypothetical protein M3270_10040 [Thermoproteota archaeon]|nr:hypothetical protein [Thermoproteota archaeon]